MEGIYPLEFAEVFKFFFALAKDVEAFIQSCFQDAYIQTAVFLTNVSKHISSTAFNLEVFMFDFSNNILWNFLMPEVTRASKIVVERLNK
jgi:hypothetical protein